MRVFGIAAVSAAFACAALLGMTSAHPSRLKEPRGELVSGREINLVLIGASFCHGAASPEFHDAVKRSRVLVAQQAYSAGRTYASLGIAVDWSTEDGIRFLNQFGQFDEISAGQNWRNAGAVKYIWRDMPGDADLPQVLIVERTVATGGNHLVVDKERVLLRLAGADAVNSWVKRGAPLSLDTGNSTDHSNSSSLVAPR